MLLIEIQIFSFRLRQLKKFINQKDLYNLNHRNMLQLGNIRQIVPFLAITFYPLPKVAVCKVFVESV